MIKRLFLFLFPLVLLGAGCVFPTPDIAEDIELPDDDAAWTAHSSVITDGVDEALIGTWVLAEQKVNGITNPFSGHQLTFFADKTLSHDYSTERTSRLPNCTVEGVVPGTFFSELEVDLDAVNEGADLDPSSGAVSTLLYVVRSAGNPLVECPGVDMTVRSNTPTLPLGTGGSGESGTRYAYEMDDNWQTLIITLESPSAVYTYKRVD